MNSQHRTCGSAANDHNPSFALRHPPFTLIPAPPGKGDIELEGLTIRKDALQSLQLPLNVLAGRISKLRIEIPWTALYGRRDTFTLNPCQ